jgi:hypothetical protein
MQSKMAGAAPVPQGVQQCAQVAAKFCAEQDGSPCIDILNRKLDVHCFCTPVQQPQSDDGSDGVSVFVYACQLSRAKASHQQHTSESRHFLAFYDVARRAGALQARTGAVEELRVVGDEELQWTAPNTAVRT